jgi:hypothetical protein
MVHRVLRAVLVAGSIDAFAIVVNATDRTRFGAIMHRTDAAVSAESFDIVGTRP